MKRNNAGKNMWLRAQTTNQKYKQNVQTQDTGGIQAYLYVTYDTVKGYVSTIILLIEGGGSEPSVSYVSSNRIQLETFGLLPGEKIMSINLSNE